MFMRLVLLSAALALIAGLGGAEPVGSLSSSAAEGGGATTKSGLFAVRARLIYTLSERDGIPERIENGVLLIEKGKVVDVGAAISIPAGVRVIDFPDAVIVPGFVDAGSEPAASVPGRETVSAKYRAIDTFDPFARNTAYLRGGVTTAYLVPDARRLMSGRGAVVKTAGEGRQSRILDKGSDLCINVCATALRPPRLQEIPLPAYSLNKIEAGTAQRPTTRLGLFLELRETFDRAVAYGRKMRDGKITAETFDYNLEVLAEAVAEHPLLRIRALRAVDIEGACSLARELKLDAYLAGGHEAHRAASVLAASGMGVVLEVPFQADRPLDDLGIWPGAVDHRIETAALLAEEGVPVALTVPELVSPAEFLTSAALAVRGGLCPSLALRAITRTPAEILGVDHRVGSLEPGKDADFVVLNAEPFGACGSVHGACGSVQQVFVDGVSVFANPAGRDALVVRAGTLLTAAGAPIDGGEVLIEGGKIKAVGHTVPHPPGARIVNGGPNSVVTPGMIDSHGHLGLEGDGSTPGPDVAIARAVVAEQDNFRPVALAGVTTVLMAPQGASGSGSQVAAIKTAGRGRDALVVDELAALKFNFRGKDPVLGLSALQKPLKKGKDYDAKWKKYYEDLKKWEEEQAKKKKEGDGKKKAEKEKKKTDVVETVEEEEEFDPISGIWEGTIQGGPLPEPEKVILKLKLEEDKTTINGSAASPMSPEEIGVSGSLQGTRVTLTVDIDSPMGAPVLEAELDAEDHMKGTVSLGDAFTADFEATRTEREAPVIKITKGKKKKAADGRPEPPKFEPALEPYRKLFAGEIPLLVDAVRHGEIAAAIKVVVEEYKIPLVILNGNEAWRVIDKVAESKVGVVAAVPLLSRKEKKLYCQAADLAGRGVPVLFQSNAGDGARCLPDMAGFAVRNGMDSTAALQALTINPARLYHIDDRVGSLQPGRDGDLVIFSGNPFDATSRVLRVFVAGKEVEP